MLEWRE